MSVGLQRRLIRKRSVRLEVLLPEADPRSDRRVYTQPNPSVLESSNKINGLFVLCVSFVTITP